LQAFISLPAILPRRNVSARCEEVYNHILQAVNYLSLKCLRNAALSLLFNVNKRLLINTYSGGGGGTFSLGVGFGLLLDGKYIPDTMTILFNQGYYNKGIKAIVSSNIVVEGFNITPDISTPEELNSLICKVLLEGSNTTVQRIRDMYPYPDLQAQKIAQDWTTDSVWAYNSQAIVNTYANKAQRYVFSVPPSSHGLDLNCMLFIFTLFSR
jgi:hypothetical protein